VTGSKDLIEGFKALEEARREYERAAAYYEGPIPEHFANEAIRRLVEDSGQGYRFRLVKVPVNAMKNRLRISSVSGGSEQVDAAIQAIRDANDMEIQEAHITERMLVYGDAYALVWPVDQDEPGEALDAEDVDAPPDEELRDLGVEISYQSPLNTRAIYDAEDGRRIRFIIRRWKERNPLGEQWRAEIWYLDRMESWISKPSAKGLDPEEWDAYAEDAAGRPVAVTPDNWPQPHDWEEFPIKHARTGLPYGRPEHADGYGPQDAITKAVITGVADIEEHGWPERARIADDAKVLEAGRDAVRWEDDTKAPASRQEEISARRRGPGREHIYTGTREVIQFPAPDPQVLMGPVDQWVRMMATVTETPFWEFDPATGAQLSGVAREKADAPMRAKEKDRKAYLLRFWREVYGLALRMAGGPEPTEPITVNWAPPDVVNDPDWWTTANVRSALGVPTAQILQEANYLPEEITAWMDEQGEEATLDQRIARLAALGDALQKVGAGASLLGIEAEAGPLISRILGEAGGKTLPPNWEPPEPEPVVDPNTDPADPNAKQPPSAPGGDE
jgi:hypothetical protein